MLYSLKKKKTCKKIFCKWDIHRALSLQHKSHISKSHIPKAILTNSKSEGLCLEKYYRYTQ